MTFVIASNNKGKLREIESLLSGTGHQLITLAEAYGGLKLEESDRSFEENAMLKARAAAKASGRPAIADDSGLEVKALDNRPGVLSARFAGEGATDEMNIEKLLEEMRHVPDGKRQARFVCVAACVLPDGESFLVRGECEGVILHKPAGTKGFGYDPVFYLPEYEKTFAQLDTKTKNKISHRAKAFSMLKEELIRRLSDKSGQKENY
jgi:XTP/dITP diphosphohydrolase